MLRWDLLLIVRYGIVTVALIITAIYVVALLLSDTSGNEKWVTVLIFSDPAMYGFLFTAVMVLFEKDARIHLAMKVTPQPAIVWLISKTTVFALLSMVCSAAIMVAAQPAYFQPLWFVAGVIMSSVLFSFVGIIGASHVKNFNQFIILMPLVLAPVCLPFVHFLWEVSWWPLYAIPSMGCLILFEASVRPVATWSLVYAIVSLAIWIAFSAHVALRTYQKQFRKSLGDA